MSGDVGREALAELLGEAVYANRELHPRQAEAVALHILASDWLMAHDAKVAAKALRDAADATRTHSMIGQNGHRTTSERPELSSGPRAWLRARADTIGDQQTGAGS